MSSGVKRFALGAMTVVIGSSLVLAGCTGSKSNTDTGNNTAPKQEGPVIGGTYIYTTIGDAKTLITTLTSDTASSFVTGFVYDPLLNRDSKLNYLPGLAEKYSIDQDKIYTFTLRKDVKFHDGTPFTADDVLFTYYSIAHPKYTGVRFGDFTGIKGWQELSDTYDKIDADLKDKKIDVKAADDQKLAAFENFKKTGGLSAPDKYTFRAELKEPFAPALDRLSGYGIMPKHLLESKIADLKNAPEAKKPVGTGGYKFIDWVKDDHITLTRNADWKFGVTGKANNVDKFIIKTVPDAQANMVALETGETDFAGIQPDNFDHFKTEVKHIDVQEYPTFSYTYLGYNTKNPMFADKRVRQAITSAIPRKDMVDQLLKGHGTIANTHSSPVRWDYNANVPVFDFNVQKAEQLLDAAGWTKGADGKRAKNGQKLAFEIATNNGNKTREQAAVIIQQALSKVGIDVKVNLMEWNAFLDYVDSDKKQAYILGWSLGFDPDMYSIFHTKGGFQMDHGYSNTALDKLIEQARQTTDQNKRKDLYGQAQQILAEDQVYTWLFYPNSVIGFNKRIHGYRDLGPAGAHWNFEEFWIADNKTTK